MSRTNLYAVSDNTAEKVKHYIQRLGEFHVDAKFARYADSGPIRILTIGCGYPAIECLSFVEYLNNLGLPYDIVGTDLDEESIADCIKDARDDANLRFAVASCFNTEILNTLFDGKKPHIVIYRHPLINEAFELTKSTALCFKQSVLRTLPTLLESGGCILTSHYYAAEKDSMNHLLALLSNSKLHMLDKSETIFERTEGKAGSWLHKEGDPGVKIYADAHMMMLVDYQPNWAIQSAIKTGFFESGNYKTDVFRALQSGLKSETDCFSVFKNFSGDQLNDSEKQALTWAYRKWCNSPDKQETVLTRLARALTACEGSHQACAEAIRLVAVMLLPHQMPSLKKPVRDDASLSTASVPVLVGGMW